MQTSKLSIVSKLDDHESGFEGHFRQEAGWNEVLVLATTLRRLQMVGTVDDNRLSRVGCELQPQHGFNASFHDQAGLSELCVLPCRCIGIASSITASSTRQCKQLRLESAPSTLPMMAESGLRTMFKSSPNDLCQFVLEPLVGGQQRRWTGTSLSYGMYF